jgi:amidase
MSGFSKYEEYDGLGLAELVRNRAVKPSELIEEAISRVEKFDPRLNMVVQKMYEQAREAAEGDLPDGPFMGVPSLLKDIRAAYAGVPLRSGSRFYKDYVPDHDSEIVRRLKSSGMVIIGRTNTPELGLLPVTEPELFGPSNNPWNEGCTTGGSSGGSAAAVAARVVPLAHGSDGGGSIRIPASCCGVFGLKPTRGRNPAGPDHGEGWHGLACEHGLTRSVRDSAAMLDATAGPDTGAPYWAVPPSRPFLSEVGEDPGRLRIAFTSAPLLPAEVHEDCVRGLEEAVRLCQDLGHETEEVSPGIDSVAFAKAFLTVLYAEIGAGIQEAEELVGRKATSRDFEPETWTAGLLGREFRAADLSRATHILHGWGRTVARLFEDYDVLLTPTLAMPPVVTGAFKPTAAQITAMKVLGRFNAGGLINRLVGIDKLVSELFRFIPFTPPFNASGQPAMSVPLHWNDDGLPIGMQFVGRYGDEATLFRLAGQLEKARPWAQRKPPICIGDAD